METAYSIEIRVFCTETENDDDVLSGLKWLVPLDFEKEKIAVGKHTALGFDDKKITIFEVMLTKRRHARAFLDNVIPKIPDVQKKMLLGQLGLRVDEHTNFYLRFDKETLIHHKELLVVDNGSCYHVKIKVTVFPSNKEKAMTVVGEMLKPKTI